MILNQTQVMFSFPLLWREDRHMTLSQCQEEGSLLISSVTGHTSELRLWTKEIWFRNIQYTCSTSVWNCCALAYFLWIGGRKKKKPTTIFFKLLDKLIALVLRAPLLAQWANAGAPWVALTWCNATCDTEHQAGTSSRIQRGTERSAQSSCPTAKKQQQKGGIHKFPSHVTQRKGKKLIPHLPTQTQQNLGSNCNTSTPLRWRALIAHRAISLWSRAPVC